MRSDYPPPPDVEIRALNIRRAVYIKDVAEKSETNYR